jgi:GNAT superfamily N-acetyltransferase
MMDFGGSAPPGVVVASEAHVGPFAEFLRQVWDPAATADSILAGWAAAGTANPITPGSPSPTFLFLSRGRVLGHLATVPAPIWHKDHTRPAYWVKGLMVLPEARNGPVGFALLKEAVRHLPIALSAVVVAPARRLLAAVGFRDLGAIPNFVAPLEATEILRRLDPEVLKVSGAMARALHVVRTPAAAALVGAALGVGLATWRLLAARGHRSSETVGLDEISNADLAALWGACRNAAAAVPVRDPAYLRRRYGLPARTYATVVVRDGSATAALAIVRRPAELGHARLCGIRVAVLSEVLYPPANPGMGLAAVSAALTEARGFGTHAVLCSASHPGLRSLLTRAGFIRAGANVHFMARAEEGNPLPGLTGWWLTRGDSGMDEPF